MEKFDKEFYKDSGNNVIRTHLQQWMQDYVNKTTFNIEEAMNSML